MDKQRLTDEQVIKALECCGSEYMVCRICPFEKHCYVKGESLSSYALDLINRQQAEIERLQKDKADIISAVEYRINQAKELAYKEFAERFEDEMGEDFFNHYPYVLAALDNLLAELTPTTLNKLPHNSLCETETYEGK